MSDIENKEEAVEEKSFFKVIIHSFFIIPFLIAVFCVLLFGGMYLLTRENRSAYDYLNDVKIGSMNKRWQAAFELSKILSNPSLLPDEDRFYNELINTFEKSTNDDERVRQYLALAMGRTGKIIFTDTLLKALADEKENNLPYIIYALGMLKDARAVEPLGYFMDHRDSRLRSITTVALGNIASQEASILLKKGLSDSEANVQWGSAISLAQMNDFSGKEIILKILDRDYLTQFKNVDAQEQTELILTVLSALKNSDDLQIKTAVDELSKNDRNMKVRTAAQGIL